MLQIERFSFRMEKESGSRGKVVGFFFGVSSQVLAPLLHSSNSPFAAGTRHKA